MLSAIHIDVAKGCVRAVLVHKTFDHVFFSDSRTYRSDAGKCALPKFSKALFILLCMNIARKFFLFQRNLRAHLLLALRPMLRCTMTAISLPFPFLSFLRSTLLYSIIIHDKLPGLRYPPSLSFQRTTRRCAPRWAPTTAATATTPSSTSPRWELWFSSPFATVSSPSARSLVSKWLRRLGGHLQ